MPYGILNLPLDLRCLVSRVLPPLIFERRLINILQLHIGIGTLHYSLNERTPLMPAIRAKDSLNISIAALRLKVRIVSA